MQEQLLRASQVLADRYLDYVEPRGDDEPLLRERYLKMCEVWALGTCRSMFPSASSRLLVTFAIRCRRDPVCGTVLQHGVPPALHVRTGRLSATGRECQGMRPCPHRSQQVVSTWLAKTSLPSF